MPSEEDLRALGQERPSEFFRDLIEPLCDSFEPADAVSYEAIMRAFFVHAPKETKSLPETVKTVYVLSRVTLGADIKVTSILLDAAKKRFPDARIVLVGGRKSAELFATDTRLEHLEANYPRSGTVKERIAFAERLRDEIATPDSIVLDPDSRITQLGLLPVGEPDRCFHFPSRTANGGNLTVIAADWTEQVLGVRGAAYIAPHRVELEGPSPWAAVSLGVGGNATKRIEGSFESDLLAVLASHFSTVWVDRGAGGEEAERVTRAAEGKNVRFWEGSFAGFASIISQCDFYVGYDSAGQHAAAAARTPLITVFAGAPSARFRERWAPSGAGLIHLLDADSRTPEQCIDQISETLRQPRR